MNLGKSEGVQKAETSESDGVINRLSAHGERLNNINGRLHDLLNRVRGSRPENVSDKESRKEGPVSGFFDNCKHNISRNDSIMEAIDGQLADIESLFR